MVGTLMFGVSLEARVRGLTGSKRTVFATFVNGYVWVDDEDGIVLSLDSFMISLAMCLRRSASLQFHWYADSSVAAPTN